MSREGKTPFEIGPGSGLEPPVRAFRTVLVLAQQLHYLMDDRLRTDGLTTRQAALLTAVTKLGNPSLSEAAVALGTTHQNVAQLAAALERKGFLRTEPHPTDRRRRCLTTTTTNTAYWQDRDPADHAAVAEWFAELSDDELRSLCALSDRLVNSLGERIRKTRDGR